MAHLNHIVARLRSTEGGVRPRLPSLFERPRALGSERLESMFRMRSPKHDEEREKPARATQATEPASRAEAAKSPIATGPRRLEGMEPQRDTAEGTPAPVPTRTSLDAKQHDTPQSAVAVRVLPVEPASRKTDESAVREPAARLPVNARPGESSTTARAMEGAQEPRGPQGIKLMREAATDLLSSVRTRRSEGTFEAAQPTENVRVITQVPAPAPGRTDRTAVQLPVVQQAAPRGSTGLRAEAAELSRPIVEVMIGRVIVQAIVPAPAPATPAPRPSAPRLSLEDYLRQREGR
jgi:hypothetical protein